MTPSDVFLLGFCLFSLVLFLLFCAYASGNMRGFSRGMDAGTKLYKEAYLREQQIRESFKANRLKEAIEQVRDRIYIDCMIRRLFP